MMQLLTKEIETLEKKELLDINDVRIMIPLTDIENKLVYCGKCNQVHLIDQNALGYCPECDLSLDAKNKVEIKVYKSGGYYNTRTFVNYPFSIVTDIKHTGESFFAKINYYSLEIYFSRNDNDKLIINSSVGKDDIIIDMKEQPYKTKSGKVFKANFSINGKEERFTLANSRVCCVHLLNAHELIMTKTVNLGLSQERLLWEIFTNYKKHPEYMKYGLGFVSDKKENIACSSLMQNIKKSEEYYKLVKKYADECFDNYIERSGCKNYYSNNYFSTIVYESSIYNAFPDTDIKYYNIKDFLISINEYYFVGRELTPYVINKLVPLFMEYEYTEDEIKALLESAYKQAVRPESLCNLRIVADSYKLLGIPFNKIPKEIAITLDRGDHISSFMAKYYEEKKNIYINNNCYCLDIDTPLNTLRKAITYSNNLNLINKLLNDYFGLGFLLVANIKDTDYIILKRNKDSAIKLYDKENEIIDINEIERILKGLV